MNPNNVVFAPLQPKTILAVVAHPDDIEVGMGGALASYIAAGTQVYYLVLTNGNKGSEDHMLSSEQLQTMRQAEQKEAAALLGVREVFFGSYDDGSLVCDMDVKRDIARCIRKVKPDVVFTLDPTFVYSATAGMVNHSDHRAAGQATLDAVFPLARDHLTFPELLVEGLEPHKVATVLMMNLTTQNYFVDITTYMDKKLAAVAAHKSQFTDMTTTEQWLRKQAEAMGTRVGAKYAEGFVRIDLAI